MIDNLLTGIRVIDLTRCISGPYCTKLMAALGAEVIKIEKPGTGDPARRLGPFPDDRPHPEASGIFLYLNAGKKSITLNLKTQTGFNILKKLSREADVLVENFEPEVRQRLNLDYDVLKKTNQKLIMTSISSFGQTGPYRDFKAGEITVFALGGLQSLLGEHGREPLKFGGSPGQYMTGTAAFSGSMAALHHADNTGEGQHVDISMMDCLLSAHIQDLVEYAYTGRIMTKFRRMLILPCEDGFVAAVIHLRQWPRLVRLLGMPELLDDPRFSTMDQRRMHADELEAYMLPWVVGRTKADIYKTGQELGIPFGYIATTEDLLKSPQYAARDFFVEIDHPVTGKLKYPGMHFKMNDIQVNQQRAPLLGEHNREIYSDRLKISEKELVKLFSGNII
jgi:crotonobetainyl-CoA:carnitine CoA-transferase CaiB-like acyl-CoA transferase